MDLLWAIVLGAYRSYRLHGAKYLSEWGECARSLLAVAEADGFVRGGLRQALKHHSEVQALGVAARLNCVQVAQLAYNMKADIARQMVLTGGGGAGAKVRSKEPTQEQIAK